jgi:hypothetical protein
MYTLAIPDRQKKRTLGYLKQNWINFEEHPSMEGFFDLFFPGMDEEAFRDISNKLKGQGVTLIGADSQLTEKNIMKLTDLMNEQALGYDVKNYPLGDEDGPSQGFETNSVGDILYDLKKLLEEWETKKYDSAEERYQEYFLDIEELVKDYEMGMTHDYEDKMDDETERALSVDAPDRFEEQIRRKIRREIKRIFQ